MPRKPILYLLVTFALCAACGTDTTSSGIDVVDVAVDGIGKEVTSPCLGVSCSTVAECGEIGPCVNGVSCENGCCSTTFSPAGMTCSAGCQIGGTCNGTGDCEGTSLKECPEEDGNPCTVASCENDTGKCGLEEALADGTSAMTSSCWDGLLCKDGKPDTDSATPTDLNLSCQEQDANLDPFGCIEQVACVDSADECLEILETDGTACWTVAELSGDTCVGHTCQVGLCVVDETLSVTCGPNDLPEDCDDACQTCTELTCHWIPDPDAPGEANKKVRYCKAAAAIGDDCEDGSDCSVGDVCVLQGQTDGPLGKETLGVCQSGEGKTKEDCLADMNRPALPCLVTGVTCTEEDGCTLDQPSADEWCYPPASVCFDKEGTYCTHLDPADGQWNEETGCHTDLIDVDCGDNNECTIDKCKVNEDEVFCEHKPVEGAACDDEDPCTDSDLCVDGECVGETKCTEDSGNPCTSIGCDEMGSCVVLPNNGAICDDNNVCTQTDLCSNGQCVGSDEVACDDNEVCTADSCDAVVGCEHAPADGACDDGNACTVNDTCTTGECAPGTPLDCNDSDVCTDDSCDPAAGCTNSNNTASCNDEDACTADDACAEGDCAGQTVICDDENSCTDDTCESDTGCLFLDNTADCNDNDACTTVDQCADGECVGTTPQVCDDDNICTDDFCEPDQGCVYASNAVECDDQDACTTLDICDGGQCIGSTPPDCNDDNPCTDDVCDPEDGCVHLPNALLCDDSDACTLNDTCNAGLCIGGPPPACDDNNICTIDSCSPDSGCIYSLEQDGMLCDSGPEWQCLTGICTCVPQCDGLQCGDDMCGSSCGECDDTNCCVAAQCQPEPLDDWAHRLGGNDNEIVDDVAVLADGSILVSVFYGSPAIDFGDGPHGNEGVYDVALVRYASNGDLIWSKTFGGDHYDDPMSVEATSDGGFVVSGRFASSELELGGAPLVNPQAAKYEGFLARFDASGQNLWSSRMGSTGPDAASAVDVADDNSIVVGGTFKNSIDLGGGAMAGLAGYDLFFGKLDGFGNHVWSKAFTGDGDDGATGISVDSAGRVYWTGGTSSSELECEGGPLPSLGQDDVVVGCHDSLGKHQWSHRLGGSGGEGYARVASYASGGVALAASYSSDDFSLGEGTLPNAGEADILIARFNVEGELIWAKAIGGLGKELPHSIEVDGESSIYLVGSTTSEVLDCGPHVMEGAGGTDGFVAKFESDGTCLWIRRLGATDDGGEETRAIDVAPDGTIVVGGRFSAEEMTVGDEVMQNTAPGTYDGYLALMEPCEPIACKPNCSGKKCGYDGCGGTCGTCEAGAVCCGGNCSECCDSNDVPWDGCTDGTITEFQVNLVDEGAQDYPEATVLDDGKFVAVWHSPGFDVDGKAVVARLFDANGTPLGPEFQVNTTEVFDQWVPVVASLADGRFAVLWQGQEEGDLAVHDVYLQVFAADGSKEGGEFQVNTYFSKNQAGTEVASKDDGQFMVSWESNAAQDGSGYGVLIRPYGADGTPTSGELHLNTYFLGDQMHHDMDGLGNSGFVGTWMGKGQDGSGYGIYAQRLSPAADKVGTEVQVNTTTAGDQDWPRVAGYSDGSYAIVWQSDGQDGSGEGVFCQRYIADGSKNGAEFKVNDYTNNDQHLPSLAAMPGGGLVVAWQGEGDEDPAGCYLRRFDSDGNKLGQEVLVHEHVDGIQSRPRVHSFENGSFIVIWRSQNQDGSSWGIFAQRFDKDGNKIYQ